MAGRSSCARVELDQPRLRLIALEDGAANWDITKKTAETAPSQPAKPVAISLKRFEITGAAVTFDDAKSKLKASLSGYDQSLTGDFSQDLVGIRTKADADTVSLTFAGIPYLNRVRLGLTADVQADLAHKSYTLKDTELRLNDLRLGVSGSARSAGKKLGLDLAFNAPEHEVPEHPLAGAGRLRARFREGEDGGHHRGLRPGEGRVRRQRLSRRSRSRPRSTTPPSSIPISRSRRGTSSSISRSPTPAAAPTAPW